MKVIEPFAVTDELLISSTVDEDDYALWNPATGYAQGARVLRAGAHVVFESLTNDNLGHDPETSPTQWIAIGATNRWAMFDEALGSATSSDAQIEISLLSDGADALAVLDTNAASIRVQVVSSGATIYDETIEPAPEQTSMFLGMPTGPGALIAITIDAADGAPVEVGTLLYGTLLDMGLTEAGPSVGITDFSRRETDDFGVTTIVPRSWAKRMNVRSLIETNRVDALQVRLAALRARPSLWIGEDYEALSIYGFFKDLTIDIPHETVSYVTLTIEGLTEAPQIITPFIGGPTLSAFLTNENHTVVVDETGAVVSYDGAGGQFVVIAGYADATDVSHLFGLETADNPQGLTLDYAGQAYQVTGGLDEVEESAVVTIRAVGTGVFSGIQLEKTFSLNKSGMGADGAPAKLLTLISDRQTIAYDAAGTPTPTTQTIAFSTNKQGTDATVTWTVTDAAGVLRTPTASYLSAATGDAVTMTEAQFAAARNSTSGVIVTATLLDGLTLFDKISVVRVKEGAKGEPGNDGVPGAGAANSFTWIVYAYSPDGTGLTVGAPGDRGYQGIATNKPSSIESSNPADYEWGLYRGPALFGLVAHANVIIGPDYIMKTSGSGWDAGAYSSEAFIGGAYMSFTAPAVAVGGVMAGLNTDPLTNASFDTIDYAFYTEGVSGDLFAYENGIGTPIGTYAEGEVLTIAYDNKSVRYHKNGAVLRTIGAAAGQRLYLDTSLANIGSKIGGLRFGPAGAAGADGPPGNPGADGLAYVQDATPGAPANPKQMWYQPSTRIFYYWNGSGWAQMTGNLARFDVVTTGLISTGTIVASHFITAQGVDLAAIVPNSLNIKRESWHPGFGLYNGPSWSEPFAHTPAFNCNGHKVIISGHIECACNGPNNYYQGGGRVRMLRSVNGGGWELAWNPPGSDPYTDANVIGEYGYWTRHRLFYGGAVDGTTAALAQSLGLYPKYEDFSPPTGSIVYALQALSMGPPRDPIFGADGISTETYFQNAQLFLEALFYR